MRRTSLHRIAAVLIVVGVAGSACGGRYSDAERLAAARPPTVAGTATAGAVSPGATSAAPSPTGGAPRGAAATLPTAAGTPGAGSAVRSGEGRGATPGGGAPAGAEAIRPVGSRGSGSADAAVRNAEPGANSPAPSAPAGLSAVGPAGAKAPIKLGQIGVRSGIVGRAMLPFYEGVIAWVNDVNRRGGLAGHPVDLVAIDDGDDPRRSLAAAKRLVETDKVVAVYGHSMLSTFDSVIPYLEAQQMPVVGSSASHTGHENTPIYFSVAYSPRTGLAWNHLMPLKLFHPEVKDVAVLYCVESDVCKVVNSELGVILPQQGYRIRYTAQTSAAQPDYTAEVLAARNAGAKALILMMDNHSAIRIAVSAHRQGYDPLFAIQATGHTEKLLRDGGKEVEGFLVGGENLHWTSPLLDDFRAAYKAYVPDGTGLSSLATVSWTAGKLLEKVAPAWPDNPRPADVMASLRALRAETLGGLMPAMTFRPGRKAGHECHTVMRVEKGQFAVFEGRNEYHCVPGYEPG
jgi:branched-chain amino acid transport system substrate-binding protein